MPSLHWHVYSFLKQIFNLFAKFAMDFGNVNVMTGLRPLAELNTKPLVKALTILKAFEDQLTLAQSTNCPIPLIAATVSKFSNRSLGSLGTNSNVGTPAPVSVSVSALPENTQNQRRDAKRDLSTTDKSTKAAATQRQMKPCRNGAIDLAKQRPVRDMGMFFFPNMILGPQISSPRTCPPRSVLTSLVRVVSVPGRTANTSTPGMLAN
jgi:hypothetical protein